MNVRRERMAHLSKMCRSCIGETVDKDAIPACLSDEANEWTYMIQFCSTSTLKKKKRDRAHLEDVNSLYVVFKGLLK